MSTNRNIPGHYDLSPELDAQRQVWQHAHPHASFADMETGVAAILNELRGRMLERLTEQATPDLPGCPAGGGRLESRGQRRRTVILEGDQQVTIQRRYAQCPACGTGLFPPG